MRIVVQLSADAARSRRARPGRAKAGVLDWLDHPLTPMHPDTTDRTFSSWFTIDAGDEAEARRLVDRLLKDSAVEAAYIKPDDAPPSQ